MYYEQYTGTLADIDTEAYAQLINIGKIQKFPIFHEVVY